MIRLRLGLVLAAVLLVTACATTTRPPVTATPQYPDYPMPTIPADLAAAPDVRDRLTSGWQRLQANDLRGARADLNAALQRDPGFYPAEAALGFVELAARQPAEASAHFEVAIAGSEDYLPAWLGQSDALLALGRDADATTALERVLALDPARDDVRARLELVRFRAVQALIDEGRTARQVGQTDEARQRFERALALSPSSALILHELADVEMSAGRLGEAERYARQAVDVDPRDAQGQATLGAVLEAREQFAEAADAYARAVALDARPEWTARVTDLRARAELAALPAEFRAVPTATEVTRGQVAAYIGIRLEALIARAPARIADVATDVRTHWASKWILPVTRAGVMSLYANHTFQPDATVPRGDFAGIVAELLSLAFADRPSDLMQWVGEQPHFEDLPTTNIRYPSVALAVAVGAMSPRAGDRFDLAAPLSGPELESAIGRIETLVR